jgi:hypothetical protein
MTTTSTTSGAAALGATGFVLILCTSGCLLPGEGRSPGDAAHAPDDAAGSDSPVIDVAAMDQSDPPDRAEDLGVDLVPPCVPSVETCNGKDDDCDGIPDYTNVGGHLISACTCNPVPIQSAEPRPDPSPGLCGPLESSVTCQIEPDGDFAMSFCEQGCDEAHPWAQCKFPGVSLDGFDADHDGHGVLEILFCNDSRIQGSLDFYYGEYPRRKWLALIPDAQKEEGVAPGCHRRLFRPSDAHCPRYETPPDDKTFPANCLINGCEKTGRWAADRPECRFEYDKRPAYLTHEFCVPHAGGQSARLHDIRVRLLPVACTCTSDADCQDLSNASCNTTVLVSDPRCPDDQPCVGVCGRAP